LTILERAAKRGDIRKDVDLGLASEVVSGAVWFYVLAGKSMLSDKDATRLVKTLVHGICPDESARGKRVTGDGNARASRQPPTSIRSSSTGSSGSCR
jgi:hypothetical protein